MSGCTATIRVDGQTITCTSHDDLSMYTHSDGLLGWSDLAPGATPANPQYRAKKLFGTASWTVWSDEEGDWSAIYSARHPDPRGAAEAEAARLHGEYANAHDAYGQVKAERDAARLRANSYKDRVLDAEAERDRYREALRKIADSPYWHEADFYARRVLDGGQP